MATLMLSSLGSAVAGPLGAVVGSLAGQAIDRSIFGSGMTTGPRLDDLRVQTSSYGSMVPRIYGQMRVAGTVIWATDLKEGTDLQSGGKGQPDALTYSYSASFAVALSSRPIRGVGRIWADGQLLRGSAGDFKVKTKFRLYTGEEDQPCDPLIASIEGLADTPAFRGLAVAVFEDLQLATFGNRIPVLTFEVIADPESPALDNVMHDLSSGIIQTDDDRVLEGYAGYGESIGDACRPLIDIFHLPLREAGLKLWGPRNSSPSAVAVHELGCGIGHEPLPPVERVHRNSTELADAVSLRFHDPSRDYQSGEQLSVHSEEVRRRRQIELPAVLSASSAKELAESNLARMWVERDRLRLRLPPARMPLAIGDTLKLPDEKQLWRVTHLSIEGMVVTVDLVRVPATAAGTEADAGRVISGPDNVAQPTLPVLMELPNEEPASGLRLHLAASGGHTPWRPVPVLISASTGEFTTMTARKRAVIGRSLQPLGKGGSSLLDLENSFDVELSHDDDWLQNCSDHALGNGENLAVLGDELIQFGTAIPLGQRRFRISRLLRGRGGTEWASGDHLAGELFVLVDPLSLTRIDLPSAALGTEVTATGLGVGDEEAAGTVQKVAAGENLRPPSPVHLRTVRMPDGGVSASWVRRSRQGWNWTETEVPLGEAVELYRVRLVGAAATIERMTSTSSCLFTAAEVVGAGSGSLSLQVAQVGEFAVSREAVSKITD